jgi:hypothetical protein
LIINALGMTSPTAFASRPRWNPTLVRSSNSSCSQRTGLFRQQLAEVEIRFTHPIDLGRLDSIANEFQNLRTPLVTLRFVLTHVFRQERSLLRLVLLCPRLLALPPVSASAMIAIRCASNRRRSSPGIVNRSPSIMSASHFSLSWLFSGETTHFGCDALVRSQGIETTMPSSAQPNQQARSATA